MRPRGSTGEVHQALLLAAQQLKTIDGENVRGPTLRELAQRACVGAKAALNTVKNMTRSGALQVVHERKVDYCNKPVAEYAPGIAASAPADDGHAEVTRALSLWVQR